MGMGDSCQDSRLHKKLSDLGKHKNYKKILPVGGPGENHRKSKNQTPKKNAEKTCFHTASLPRWEKPYTVYIVKGVS